MKEECLVTTGSRFGTQLIWGFSTTSGAKRFCEALGWDSQRFVPTLLLQNHLSIWNREVQLVRDAASLHDARYYAISVRDATGLVQRRNKFPYEVEAEFSEYSRQELLEGEE